MNTGIQDQSSPNKVKPLWLHFTPLKRTFREQTLRLVLPAIYSERSRREFLLGLVEKVGTSGLDLAHSVFELAKHLEECLAYAFTLAR